MPNRRAARVAERIREDVSLFLIRDLHDPRLELVTITRVAATDDLRRATVYYSVLGDEAKRRTAERGLASARGLIRSHVAKGLGLREAPELAFQFDPSIEKAIEMTRLLDQVGAELRARHPEAPPPEPDAEDPGE
ncbi:MAG TPA: 30S ribosome-binding factor RbfA [Planctomycetota bacterium]|nr:30S ribosome-binding factor RbfA [Planctomycetota bacterium]